MCILSFLPTLLFCQLVCVQVVLRSINSSKSAYFSVSFQNTFFDEYNVFQRNIVQAGVLMKVKIWVSPSKVVAAFQLHCCFAARPDSIPHTEDLPPDSAPGHRRKHPPARGSR